MRGTWIGAALVLLGIAGCPGAPSAPGDAGTDAQAVRDAGRDAHALADAGIDAATPLDATAIDAGTDAPIAIDAGTDAPSHDAGPRPDTNADAALFCPVGGECTLDTGLPGQCCADACVDLRTDGAN